MAQVLWEWLASRHACFVAVGAVAAAAQKAKKVCFSRKKKNRQFTTQMFRGNLGGEHEHPFWLIEYPKPKQCNEYGTEAQAEAEQHAMNLATMLTDLFASEDGVMMTNF